MAQTSCDVEFGPTRIDQDGHFSIACNGGRVYAFTVDGTTAWYNNGINAFRFTQDPIPVPGNGARYEWHTYNFGC